MAIFDPPQNKHPLTDHQIIWYRWLRRRPLRLRQIWCKSVNGGLQGKWVKYNEIFFIYLFIPFFHQLTYRSDATTDFHAWWFKRRGLAQGCAFWGFLFDIAPILGVKSPQNPNFWGLNRRFQAKRVKYWKFHVIETTASISTKFCTTIETIDKSSWVVPIGAQQIQDSGRPPFWIFKNSKF